MQQPLPKAGVKSEMLSQLYKLKIYKYVTNSWLFEYKSNVQSFVFSYLNPSFCNSPYQTDIQIIE